MDYQKLAEVMNKEFGAPFLPEDHVRACVKDNGNFVLIIGRRDIELNSNGVIVGSGTFLKEPKVDEPVE